MYELDKQAFGAFLAALRKEKGYTQKDLAAKLFVSDKAVSKWERGLSVPDVSLLVPLAELLDVTVTELLEGRRLDTAVSMPLEEADVVVKKALTLAEEQQPDEEETPAEIRRRFARYCALVIVALLVSGFVWQWFALDEQLTALLWVGEGIALIFGLFFRFGCSNRLPAYYDQYPVDVVTFGMLRLHMMGMHFNNRNWPHLLRTLHIWSAAAALALPPVCALLSVISRQTGFRFNGFTAIPLLLSLFLPLYYVGKKYEFGETKK